MSYVVYSTDSEEHLINIGEISQPFDELTQQEMQEDINAMNDYIDQLGGEEWDGE